jgi:hypothetical protein
MSTRKLASPKQRRGEITTVEDVARVFRHLTKDKLDPAHPQKNPWKLKPFKGIIRGNKHQSSLPHNVEVQIRNGMQYADYLNISKNTFLSLIYKDFPTGSPLSSKTLADSRVSEYQKTLCHQYLKKHYENRVTGKWSSQGENVDAMGQNLFMMFNQRDPALFTLEMFQQARNDPRFFDAQGKIKFAPLSQIRCIMKFAALQIADSPLSQRRFQFLKGDEWDTTGKKNIGGKKEDFLQDFELKAYIEHINEIDTLVLHRMGFEGGGRISSQLLMGKTIHGTYRCQPLWDLGFITMFEPKVEGSKTGGKVKRYFVPETMAFFKRYVNDFNIVGAWFQRYPSDINNYQSYSASIKLAGLRAGIWRFKRAQKGQPLQEGEKIAPNGLVYRLNAVRDNRKGTQAFRKQWVTEGKMTTSHTVMKHTFVSLAGLHGFNLDNCAEQCGTDPTTIRDFYHGTLGVGLQKVVIGERTFVPWQDWIRNFVDPIYTKRYNELRSKGKATVELNAIAKEMAAMAEVEE